MQQQQQQQQQQQAQQQQQQQQQQAQQGGADQQSQPVHVPTQFHKQPNLQTMLHSFAGRGRNATPSNLIPPSTFGMEGPNMIGGGGPPHPFSTSQQEAAEQQQQHQQQQQHHQQQHQQQSAALLDAAILDLTRRRLSLATGGHPGMMPGPPPPPHLSSGTSLSGGPTKTGPTVLGGFPSSAAVANNGNGSQLGVPPPPPHLTSPYGTPYGPPGGVSVLSHHGPPQQQQQQQHGGPPLPPLSHHHGGPPPPHAGAFLPSHAPPAPHAAAAAAAMYHGHAGSNANAAASAMQARQQQLQREQAELQQQQAELDRRRQQLFAASAATLSPFAAAPEAASALTSPFVTGVVPGAPLPPTMTAGPPSQTPVLRNLHSPLQQPMNAPTPAAAAGAANNVKETNNGTDNSNSASGFCAPDQKWWVCHICNSKAFVSREDALEHEAECSTRRAAAFLASSSTKQQQPAQASTSTTRRTTSNVPAVTFANPPVTKELDKSATSTYGGTTGSSPTSSSLKKRTTSQQPHTVPQGDAESSTSSSTSPSLKSRTTHNGSYAILDHPIALAMESDKDWLTPLHCLVRRHCVQLFCASAQDVTNPNKGKRKQIQVGQVGIRCPHCFNKNSSSSSSGSNGKNENYPQERGSVYYPTTTSSIYDATLNLLQRHFANCPSVPADIRQKYMELKADDARSGTSKKYWIESALSLGLVDTPQGIRFSTARPPALPCLGRHQQHNKRNAAAGSNHRPTKKIKSATAPGTRTGSSNKMGSPTPATTPATVHPDEQQPQQSSGQLSSPGRLNNPHAPAMTPWSTEQVNHTNNNLSYNTTNNLSPSSSQQHTSSTVLVTPEDRPFATAFSYQLVSQMQPCVFTEADRLGKRKGLPEGFAGLACKHCFGGYGSGRFFPSSIKTLSDTSKTLNVLHNHMMRCRKCPLEVRETLEQARSFHDEERAKMKFGSQKAFFAKIWSRLHEQQHDSCNTSSTPGSPVNTMSTTNNKNNSVSNANADSAANAGSDNNTSAPPPPPSSSSPGHPIPMTGMMMQQQQQEVVDEEEEQQQQQSGNNDKPPQQCSNNNNNNNNNNSVPPQTSGTTTKTGSCNVVTTTTTKSVSPPNVMDSLPPPPQTAAMIDALDVLSSLHQQGSNNRHHHHGLHHHSSNNTVAADKQQGGQRPISS